MVGTLQVVSNPVLVGSAKGMAASFTVNYVGCKNRKAAEAPAETGHAETGEEFAAHGLKNEQRVRERSPPQRNLVLEQNYHQK